MPIVRSHDHAGEPATHGQWLLELDCALAEALFAADASECAPTADEVAALREGLPLFLPPSSFGTSEPWEEWGRTWSLIGPTRTFLSRLFASSPAICATLASEPPMLLAALVEGGIRRCACATVERCVAYERNLLGPVGGQADDESNPVATTGRDCRCAELPDVATALPLPLVCAGCVPTSLGGPCCGAGGVNWVRTFAETIVPELLGLLLAGCPTTPSSREQRSPSRRSVQRDSDQVEPRRPSPAAPSSSSSFCGGARRDSATDASVSLPGRWMQCALDHSHAEGGFPIGVGRIPAEAIDATTGGAAAAPPDVGVVPVRWSMSTGQTSRKANAMLAIAAATFGDSGVTYHPEWTARDRLASAEEAARQRRTARKAGRPPRNALDGASSSSTVAGVPQVPRSTVPAEAFTTLEGAGEGSTLDMLASVDSAGTLEGAPPPPPPPPAAGLPIPRIARWWLSASRPAMAPDTVRWVAVQLSEELASGTVASPIHDGTLLTVHSTTVAAAATPPNSPGTGKCLPRLLLRREASPLAPRLGGDQRRLSTGSLLTVSTEGIER